MFHHRSLLSMEIPTFQSTIRRETLTARVAAILRTWRERRAMRRELARIDARSLRDIGIAPELVAYEIAQPFWRDLRDWRA